ncbi:MAG: hypothetical protein VXZ72_04405, partial [Chlamydiota bacterium]|nr:hypothetical protein [Chlamydiota bacterium]
MSSSRCRSCKGPMNQQATYCPLCGSDSHPLPRKENHALPSAESLAKRYKPPYAIHRSSKIE